MIGATPEEMYLLIPKKCQKCKYNSIQRLMYCEDCMKEKITIQRRGLNEMVC